MAVTACAELVVPADAVAAPGVREAFRDVKAAKISDGDLRVARGSDDRDAAGAR